LAAVHATEDPPPENEATAASMAIARKATPPAAMPIAARVREVHDPMHDPLISLT